MPPLIQQMRFVLQNLSFLNPENRKHSKCNIEAIINRFCKEITTAKLQYSAYRNDDSLEFLFLNSRQRADIFFINPQKCQNIISSDCLSPDTVECERGFSTMNLTKDKFSTRLVQANLQAHTSVLACLQQKCMHTTITST